MSATARNDTGTDLAGISVLSLDFPPPTRLHSSLHPKDSTTCVVRSQQLDNLDAPSKNNVQDIWYMRKSPLRSMIVRKNAPLACVHQPEGAKLTHRRHSDRVLRSKLSLKRVTYDGARWIDERRGRHGQGREREELKSRGPRGGIRIRRWMHGGSGNAGAGTQQHQCARVSEVACWLRVHGLRVGSATNGKTNGGKGQSCGSVPWGF